MNTIFTARLLSGDHILGKLEAETASGIHLKDALLVGIMQGRDGSPELGFSPISHFAARNKKGHDVVIPQSSLLCVVDFDEEIINAYKQTIGDIITPPSSLIVP